MRYYETRLLSIFYFIFNNSRINSTEITKPRQGKLANEISKEKYIGIFGSKSN